MKDVSKIKLFGFDVDGTLTPGTLIFGEYGEAYKLFNAQDGMVMPLARKLGYKIVFITGRKSLMVESRANELGIDHLVMGSKNKVLAMNEVREKYELAWDEIAYMGDDINDLPLGQKVGFFACPANSCVDNLEKADCVTQKAGGQGAAREVIEYVLRKQQRWEEVLALFENF